MKLIVSNAGIIDVSELKSDLFISDSSVYEVIRVIRRIPLFLEDHFDRLIQTLKIQEIEFTMTYHDFLHKICELIRINNQAEGNVRFAVNCTEISLEWTFSFIPSAYPSLKDYRNGVSTDLFFDERLNPNAKVIQGNIREKTSQLLADRNLYEVLLTNRNGLITEGSRSNVFFVKRNIFYTAPESLILIGITRQKVIACLPDLGFQLIEEAINFKDLDQFDAVFLTGTSPKVLPVKSIGNLLFHPQNQYVQKVRLRYDELINEYMEVRKNSETI